MTDNPYRGLTRRHNRKERNLDRANQEANQFKESTEAKISLWSYGSVDNNKPVDSLLVNFRFSKPITPNEFYSLLMSKIYGEI